MVKELITLEREYVKNLEIYFLGKAMKYLNTQFYKL